MTTKLILRQELTYSDFPHNNEATEVIFERKEDFTVDEFFDYLIRFALAAGYQSSNIEDELAERGKELNDETD